jgi:hypothetical protein
MMGWRLVGAARHAQGEVVHVAAAGYRIAIAALKQRDALRPGMQKHLPVVLAVDVHAETLGVERFRPLHIGDMKHDVIDPARLDHLVPPFTPAPTWPPWLEWTECRGTSSASSPIHHCRSAAEFSSYAQCLFDLDTLLSPAGRERQAGLESQPTSGMARDGECRMLYQQTALAKHVHILDKHIECVPPPTTCLESFDDPWLNHPFHKSSIGVLIDGLPQVVEPPA